MIATMNSTLSARALAGIAMAASIAATAPAQAAPVFTLDFISGTTPAEQAAFAQAAAIWSGLLADNVTVNLTVGTTLLGPSILASANSADATYLYSDTRTALQNDATSSNDATAVANLQAGPNLRLLINGTSNVGGSLSSTYVDSTGNNTARINMTTANAKALGLSAVPITSSAASGCITAGCDGRIAFSTAYSWDTDRTDGISPGQFDFIGIAVHEIGHALGFISGVDILDGFSSGPYYNDDAFTYVAPLDLYRCSAASAAQSVLDSLPTLDWTVGTATKNFSLNNCGTVLATFSTGMTHGDGRQASHWKDNLSLGAMDPTSAPGETISLTALDLTAFDVIGWNLASTPTVSTPAPASALVFAFGLAGLGLSRRRTLA